MRVEHARRACLAVAAAMAVTACDTGPSGTGLVPTFVTPTAKTEIFSGTVPVGGSDSHPFASSNYGELSITLTSAGPAPDIVMGVGIGAPTSIVDSSCRLYQNAFVTTAAGSTPQLTGNIPAGSYCVQVFDAGNQTAPVIYSVTVVHVQ